MISYLSAINHKMCQECVKAMDKNWHPEHFQCVGCSVQFSGSLTYRESGENILVNISDATDIKKLTDLITQGERPSVTSVMPKLFCQSALVVAGR